MAGAADRRFRGAGIGFPAFEGRRGRFGQGWECNAGEQGRERNRVHQGDFHRLPHFCRLSAYRTGAKGGELYTTEIIEP
jgi:hypothetical protein